MYVVTNKPFHVTIYFKKIYNKTTNFNSFKNYRQEDIRRDELKKILCQQWKKGIGVNYRQTTCLHVYNVTQRLFRHTQRVL